MGFAKGEKEFKKGQGGRPKGSKNKRTQEAHAIAEQYGFNAIEALIHCYKEAMIQYEYYKELLLQGRVSPMEDNGKDYLKTASANAKEIASFIYPKLKSVERIKDPDLNRPLKNISDEELDKL